MCLACEEAQMYYRWQLLQQIARGEMPNGYTADDLRALDLPLPGEVRIVERNDGTLAIEKVSDPSPAARPAGPKANGFVCDSPDGE